MTTASTPLLRKKNAVYQNNVHHRGQVKTTLKSSSGLQIPVSYWVLGLLAFVTVGGAVLQVIDLVM
ncbi:hypothetical protein DM01DRAFT_362998 [Hesseltinella vesiculosa]|uniref:Stress-associated endoplasmic reticulum protein n=1 Tax=Hesseltinella vesiculosa TaxID=101127 RepID=A0A1X2GWU7_9FUNG|nr:hypothetical protein DM01DRAFT_362998 [Hesseltinella vesiculosa]